MNKIAIIILFSLILYSCTAANSNKPSLETNQAINTNMPEAQLSGLEANKENISQNDPEEPKWFSEMTSESFNYVVKNAEMSSDKELAELKNIAISEILLANKIENKFMTISDQAQYIDMIRDADNFSSVNELMNNKLIESIISGYTIKSSETIQYEAGFINYLYLSKLKK